MRFAKGFFGAMRIMKNLIDPSKAIRFFALSFLSVICLFAMAGCKTGNYANLEKSAAPNESMVLTEGDTVQVTFPGAPNLNTVQKIRRDGRITLQVVGEFAAAGLTPDQMEKKLLELYANELVQKEVSVTVQASIFPVFVTGAVMHPGKVVSDRPLSALEAIMEAGGFDHSKANLKSVTVIRQENGQVRHYYVNLKVVLQGHQGDTFTLKPSDIVYVPERFTWF